MINKRFGFTTRYFVALGLVAILACITFWISLSISRAFQNDAALILISSRQHGLADQISEMAFDYATSDGVIEQNSVRREFRELLTIFKQSHQALMNGGRVSKYQGVEVQEISPISSPELQNLYFGDTTQLDEQVSLFVVAAERLLDQPIDELAEDNLDLATLLEATSSTTLLANLELAFEQYQVESDARSSRLFNIGLLLLLGILLILFLKALFIFYPISNQMNEQAIKLQEGKEQLSVFEQKDATRMNELLTVNEINRQIINSTDLDTLLFKAVELIQDRFQLYYAQIYLLDKENYALVLRAGSGEVGQTLVQNGFDLPLGLNSINGQAAIEKQTVVVEDASQQPIFRANKLLPDACSEMALPLTHNNELVGVLDLQSNQVGGLSLENKEIFETISTQLAMAIQYVRLSSSAYPILTEAGRSHRFEWDAFLDGIHEPRVISIKKENETTAVNATTNGEAPQRIEQIPIQLVGEDVGMIELLVENGRFLSEGEKEMVGKVSELVSQRIENLRLLSTTERYRQEAEQATRRLTREISQKANRVQSVQGFEFDLKEVAPLNGSLLEEEQTLIQPIELRGDVIGQLEISDKEVLTSREADLLTAVSEQFSNHIENLQLLEQIENSLIESETYSTQLRQLNELSTKMNALTSSEEIAQIAAEWTRQIVGVDRISLTLIDSVKPDKLIVAGQSGQVGSFPIGTLFDLDGSAMQGAIISGQVEEGGFDIGNDQLSVRYFPLVGLRTILGTMNIGHSNDTIFTDRNKQLLNQIALSISSALEAKILFEQNQISLAETETLYKIVSNLNKATSLKDIVDAIIESPIGQNFSRISYSRIEVDKNNFPEWLILEDVRTQDNLELENNAFSMGARFQVSQTPFSDIWVKNPNEPVIIEDIINDDKISSQFKNYAKSLGTGTIVVVPLHLHGRWLGLIRIAWGGIKSISEHDKRLIRTITEQSSIVANQHALFEDATSRAELLAELAQIEGYLSQAISENDILEAVQRACAEPTSITLFHFENDENSNPSIFHEVARWKEGAFQKPYKEAIPLTETHPIFNQWQSNPNQLILVEDSETHPDMDEEARNSYINDNVKSFLLMPLISLGRWQGALEVHWNTLHKFDSRELFLIQQLMETIAANVASKRSLSETEMLYQVNEKLNQAEQYEDILKIFNTFSLLSQTADVMNIGYFNKPFTLKTHPDWIDIVGQISKNQEGESSNLRFYITDIPSFKQLDRDEPSIFEDVLNDSRLDEQIRITLIDTAKAKSIVFFPLVVGSNWFGYVACFFKEQQSFHWGDVQRLFTLVEQSAVAIQGIRFLRLAETRAFREQQIREIAAKVHNSTSVESILRTAAVEVGKALGRHSVVYLDSKNDEKNGEE